MNVIKGVFLYDKVEFYLFWGVDYNWLHIRNTDSAKILQMEVYWIRYC